MAVDLQFCNNMLTMHSAILQAVAQRKLAMYTQLREQTLESAGQRHLDTTGQFSISTNLVPHMPASPSAVTKHD
jgi:hypothetical protein